MTTDVYNIGDQDQDHVKVILQSSLLDINEFYEIKNDLDQGDREQVSLQFTIPQDAEDKNYVFELSAEYEYDDGDYDEESDEPMDVALSVIGCEALPEDDDADDADDDSDDGPLANFVLINAVLDSDDAIAGQPLVIRTTVTNLKSGASSFAVSATGYESWSTLDSVSPQIFSLGPGESRDVMITLNADEGIVGEEVLTIEVRSASGLETRELSVNIEEASTASESPFAGFNLGDNAYLWIIGVINVVLVILIIVVAVKISRR